MPPRITSVHHRWVLAAVVPVDDESAERALIAKHHPLPAGGRIDVLDAYCAACHRPYPAVAGRPCESAESNEHLRGGPVGGKRRGREHMYHNCLELGCWPGDVVPEGIVGVPAGPLRISRTG